MTSTLFAQQRALGTFLYITFSLLKLATSSTHRDETYITNRVKYVILLTS